MVIAMRILIILRKVNCKKTYFISANSIFVEIVKLKIGNVKFLCQNEVSDNKTSIIQESVENTIYQTHIERQNFNTTQFKTSEQSTPVN